MNRARRRLGAEEGFSLIEVLVGAMITITIAGAMAIGLVNNNDSALGTQRQAQLVAVLQARIEWVRQILLESYPSKGFSAVALSQNPAKGEHATLPTTPTDPNDFITHWSSGYNTATSGIPLEGFLIEKNYNGTSEGVVTGASSEGETLQVDTTNGMVPPVSYIDLATGTSYSSASSVPSTHSYAIVNTYVTLASEVAPAVPVNCPTTAGTGSDAADTRRIIVAARLVPANAQTNADLATPQYATTLLTNPTPSNSCQTSLAGPLG